MFGVVIVSFIPIVDAITYDIERKGYIDFQPYTGNRNFVFNDTCIDYCILDNLQNPIFNNIAIKAVEMWHDKIVKVTNNSDVWDMKIHVLPKDTTICDGYVNYYATPNSTSSKFTGTMGFSNPDTPVANVTIFTDNYQKNIEGMKTENPNVLEDVALSQIQDMTQNNTHVQFNSTIIEKITLHEIGHSLGLNHPSDENLSSAKGIMGYNMSYNEIDDKEVRNVVKTYPNGFTSVVKPSSISLDKPEWTRSVNLGDVVNLTIEFPYKRNDLPITNFELYIFPDGEITKKQDAPIKIIRKDGQNQLVNSDYINNVHFVFVNLGDNDTILSLQFKAVKEFTNAGMIIVSHDSTGLEKQWSLNNVLSVKKALFSDMLLDFDDSSYVIQTRGGNPNRMLESHHDRLQQEYDEALILCLSHKNMKNCSEINIQEIE